MPNDTLPVREPIGEGESLTGFVRRHVLAMGYESFARLLNLAEDSTFPRQLENLNRGPLLTALATLLRRDADELLELTIHQGDRRSVSNDFDPSRRRICPSCIADCPTRENLLWLLRPMVVCPEHGVLLIDRCRRCDRALSSQRLDLLRCRCGENISAGDSEPLGNAALDAARAVQAWFALDEPDGIGLRREQNFWWLGRLQAAIFKAPTWLGRTRLEMQLPAAAPPEVVAWLAATELLRTWPRNVAEFLDEFQESEGGSRPTTRIGRSFSRLLGDAERLERSGYGVPAEVLRTYLLERYTRGHLSGKGSLFRDPHQRRKISERPWIAQTVAAEMLGLRTPSVAELVRRNVLQGRIQVSGTRGRTNGVVSRASIVEYARRMNGALSVKQIAEQLGMAGTRVLELIRADLLPDSIRGPLGWRVPLDSFAALQALLRKLPRLQPAESGWIPISAALRRFGVRGVSLVRIAQRLLSGELSARRTNETVKFSGLSFRAEELHRLTRSTQEERYAETGYALTQLGPVLFLGRSLRPIVLRKWIAAGLLRGSRQRKAWHITSEEVVRFRATYCLAREARSLLQIARSTLDLRQAQRRLVPVYGRLTHPGAGASVFLRADVERLLAARIA